MTPVLQLIANQIKKHVKKMMKHVIHVHIFR